MPVATPDLTPVPGSPSIEPTPVPQDINQLELPTPACPSPGTAGEPPAVRVAIGGAAPIIATPGSSELRTCSTVGTSDATGEDPKVGVTAHAGDKLTLSGPAGWSILAYQSSDHPAGGEETNPRPLVILPAASTSVQLLVPKRSGRSIVDVVLAVVSDSGQVVGRIDARFQVKVG
jgi:hypothetical protein